MAVHPLPSPFGLEPLELKLSKPCKMTLPAAAALRVAKPNDKKVPVEKNPDSALGLEASNKGAQVPMSERPPVCSTGGRLPSVNVLELVVPTIAVVEYRTERWPTIL